MDDDFEIAEDECDHVASYRWNAWVLVIALFQVLHGIASGFKYAAESLLESSVAAANHEVDRREFANQARVEIETITEASDG